MLRPRGRRRPPDPSAAWMGIAQLWTIRAMTRQVVSATGMSHPLMGMEEALQLVGLPENTMLKDRRTARRLVRRRLAALERHQPSLDFPLFHNLERLGRMLGLDAAEKLVLAFATLSQARPEIAAPLAWFKSGTTTDLARALAGVLQLEEADAVRALQRDGALVATGLLRQNDDERPWRESPLQVMQGLDRILMDEHSDDAALVARFARRAPQPALTADDFPHLHDELQLLCTVLRNARQSSDAGFNVLIFGAPGTGKTEFARIVAAMTSLDMHEVPVAEADGDPVKGPDRLARFMLCQRLFNRSQSSLMLFDEMEDVFPDEGMSFFAPRRRSGRLKGFTNRALEENPVPTLWISNTIGQVDPAFLRRFVLQVEIKNPPRAVRQRMLERHLDGLAVGERVVQRLADCEKLSPADMESVARVVRLAEVMDSAAVERTIDRVLAARLGARGDAFTTGALRRTTIQYDLAYVNASLDVGALAGSLCRNPAGSILLYGPPGTGKTEYSRHVAERLGKPLLVRRASDLLDMFVGNTEKLIAQMFGEARAAGAVLLLDEADGFLGDRRGAVRSWEVTQVNELLVQMEAFEGLFFCGTNLVDRLDQASFRRFMLKVQFSYMTAEQSWKMFGALAADVGLSLPEGGDLARLRAELGRQSTLTPGDFATVRRQLDLLGQAVDPGQIVERLDAECRMKHDGESRAAAIGFRG
ncbi:MAG: AAA family ATPase [Deltaproteobacteria bacterium]|nr:AAA family ATPase [Deltaproteobacteria bacterium]